MYALILARDETSSQTVGQQHDKTVNPHTPSFSVLTMHAWQLPFHSPTDTCTSSDMYSCSALQLMDSIGLGGNGWNGAPGERPPNMLASIQSYLNRTQELMQNPTVLLPSLPDPPAPGSILLPLQVAMHCVASVHCPGTHYSLASSAFLLDPLWFPFCSLFGESWML